MSEDEERGLASILVHATAASGIDFLAYKPATLERRVHHRMAMTACESFAEYLAKLGHDAGETASLIDALLIKVTSMFREGEMFDRLREVALPALLRERVDQGAKQVRAWVPACSTGEEAFSMAMCLLEAAEKTPLECSVLASDVDRAALEHVARGSIREENARSVPAAFAKWLTADGDRYVVADGVRAIVTSAYHDVLGAELHAPQAAVIASFDVVSCRNLLIYLRPEAQRRIVERLVKACAPGALLVLGEAEMPLDPPDGVDAVRPDFPLFRVRSR